MSSVINVEKSDSGIFMLGSMRSESLAGNSGLDNYLASRSNSQANELEVDETALYDFFNDLLSQYHTYITDQKHQNTLRTKCALMKEQARLTEEETAKLAKYVEQLKKRDATFTFQDMLNELNCFTNVPNYKSRTSSSKSISKASRSSSKTVKAKTSSKKHSSKKSSKSN